MKKLSYKDTIVSYSSIQDYDHQSVTTARQIAFCFAIDFPLYSDITILLIVIEKKKKGGVK